MPPRRLARRVDLRRIAPGVLAVVAIALAAWLLARIVRIEATLIALLLGLAAGALLRHPRALEPGAQVALKRALTGGVVLLGAEVNLAFLMSAGPRAVALALILVPVTIGIFWLLARALRVDGDAWLLLGTGTAICGLSAVIATGATLRSRERDVAVAAAAVGVLSAVGLVVYPLLALVLPVSAEAYGAWSGLSLHAVANAVAAGFAHGDAAGRVAALTKFTRVALLAPVLIVLALMLRHKAEAKGGGQSLLPPMVWGFLLVALAASLLPVPEPVLELARQGAKALLLLGIAGIGYTTRLGHVREAGPRAMALAVAGWVALSVLALVGSVVLYG